MMNISNKNHLLLLILAVFLFAGIDTHAQVRQEDSNGETLDLSTLDWSLFGYRPETWRMNFDFNAFKGSWAEISDIPLEVPGSVRNALLIAGLIPDWNYGLNNTASEWVENRNWLFATRIPDNWLQADHQNVVLHCSGLDHSGRVMINGQDAGQFNNSFIPYSFNISPFLKESNNTIVIVFECPPRYLGQIGYTSTIKDWKPRFYYGWDWMPRIVQTGISDNIWLSIDDGNKAFMDDIQIITDAEKTKDKGILKIKANLNSRALKAKIGVTLSDGNGKRIFEDIISGRELVAQKTWSDLKVKRWWPNGSGEQVLYNLQINLPDENGDLIQQIKRRIGFKNVEWLACEDAPENADPWLCSVNNKPVFLQGINWTPIRPNYADLIKEDYKKRLVTYKELGINIIRVWGGGFTEKQWLYDLCDETGIMILQDFPLSSSGIDNYPPEDIEEVFEMTTIVKTYLNRTQHNVSVLMWCGGNELYNRANNAPITDKHVMIRAIKDIVNMMDPSRRFINSSPTGLNISATRANFGSGRNWDVHGPWKLPYTATDSTMNAVKEYWTNNDALFISEAGAPGAMSAEMITKYAGEYNPLPANIENPIWRNVNWWIDWDEYIADHNGRDTKSLDDYVQWSQQRQLEGLSIALKSRKDRFPKTGGFIIWMGHDSFPCMVNTSILDFEGNPKPVAYELSKIWKNNNDSRL